MFIPSLNLPSFEVIDTSNIQPRPKNITAWLNSLPLADVETSASQVLDVLRRYNRCHMPPELRFQSLDSISRVCYELVKALSTKYRESAYPLSERNRVRHQLVNQFLEEMAYGFKHIAHDFFERIKRENKVDAVLFDAIRVAMVYLSRRLVSAYSVYENEPPGVWLDLHQLYKIAEVYDCMDCSSEKNENILSKIHVVQHTYVRIVLLAIANPYHLMQGEAQLIYNYLNKWCTGVKIQHIPGYICAAGDLVIDVNNDKLPYFMFSKNMNEPRETRTVEMKRLIERFHDTVEALTTRKEAAGVEHVNMTFTERLRRDMILRLQSVWNGRFERKYPRKVQASRIRIAAGLSTAHYFVDREREFFPESDEVHYYRPKDLGATLSLVPDDYEPWKYEQQEHQISAGLEEARISKFQARTDVWEKIYATQAYARSVRESAAVHYTAYHWRQLNISDNGIGVSREFNCNARVTVGSIVAYQREHEADNWSLGMIRWIREYTKDRFEMGIQFMEGKPGGAAVRAVAGAGCGSEYFRAILVENVIEHAKVKLIIVPAAIYDIGTYMVLNTRDTMQYIKLNKLLRTTTCCAIYTYGHIDIPDSEKDKIKKLKST